MRFAGDVVELPHLFVETSLLSLIPDCAERITLSSIYRFPENGPEFDGLFCKLANY
jgi:hypothetical protein